MNCVPCNQQKPTYKNRLNSTYYDVGSKEEKTLETVRCGKEIVSITQVGETLVVMNSDCSYSTAPVSKLNLEEPNKNGSKVISISKANGKVLITLSNGGYLEAEMAVLDSSLQESMSKTHINDVKKLNEFKTKLEENLVPIKDLGDNTTHYAIAKDFSENK